MQTMEEHVLVIPERQLNAVGSISGFRPFCEDAFRQLLDPQWMEFRPRSRVEQDPSVKQLIPYAILEAEIDGDLHVFQYTRGRGQGEARLHASKSIGIGGHISQEDSAEQDIYTTGMLRELDEEVEIGAPYSNQLVGFIFDDSSEVGRVHLGVVHRLRLEHPEVSAREADLVESGFAPVADLKHQPEDFETWSQLCLQHLY